MLLFNLFSLIKTAREMGKDVATGALQYHLALRRLNRQFRSRPVRGRFQTLGKVSGFDSLPHGLVIHAERGHLEIIFTAPDIVRVRMSRTGTFAPPFSYALAQVDWPPVTVQTGSDGTHVTLQSDQLVCRVRRDTCHLTVETPSGETVSTDSEGFAFREDQVRWTRQLPADETCHGLGQRAAGLNLRGHEWALWNADPVLYNRGDDPVYFSIPFYLGVRPTQAVGILWDNPARGAVDTGSKNADEMSFFAESGELRFYLIAGPTAAAILERYTTLTGRIPLPPIWTLGFHQCRWSYDSEAEFRTLAKEFRERRLPCDVLYFDIDYMDGFRCFTWNRERFPMLPKLLSDLEAQGFKSVAIIDPGIKVDPDYDVYKDGLRQGVFLTYPNGKLVSAPVWPGTCHFPDFSKAAVRAWWGGYVARLVQAGFAGLWNDMNEPALITGFGTNTLPDYVVHDWDGAGQTHVGGGHNTYGLLMARATREGLRKAKPDQRPFVMTRAGFAGAQRYTSSWTGDNVSTWDHLKLSISMVLNLGLSGMPVSGPDVGGFGGAPDGELFARWMQVGSMLPYFRVHSAKGTPRQEPWSFGPQVEAISRQAIELRYRLLPYLYSVFAQASQQGMPIIRPLFMADPADDHLRECDDAFMLGDALLVAPIVEKGATQRTLYLPKGVWYEFDTGKLIDGARSVSIDAPLERLPLYVRAGKVLPMWPLMQYVGEKPLEEMHLRAFAGSNETTFYEDSGQGLDYQNGAYRWSYFTCKFLPSGQFAVEWRRAGQYTPPYAQVRVELVGISGEPEAVMIDGQNAPIWYYEAGMVEFVTRPFSEARIVGRSPQSSGAQQTLPRPPRSSSDT